VGLERPLGERIDQHHRGSMGGWVYVCLRESKERSVTCCSESFSVLSFLLWWLVAEGVEDGVQGEELLEGEESTLNTVSVLLAL